MGSACGIAKWDVLQISVSQYDITSSHYRTIVQYNVMHHMYKQFIIITHSVYSQRVQHNYNKDGTSSVEDLALFLQAT